MLTVIESRKYDLRLVLGFKPLPCSNLHFTSLSKKSFLGKRNVWGSRPIIGYTYIYSLWVYNEVNGMEWQWKLK